MPDIIVVLADEYAADSPQWIATVLRAVRAVARALEDDALHGPWSFGTTLGVVPVGFFHDMTPTGREETRVEVTIPARYLTEDGDGL